MSRRKRIMKQGISVTTVTLLIGGLVASPLSLGGYHAEKVSAATKQNVKAASAVIALENGDFENPRVTATNQSYQLFNQADVPGWNTTASDSLIEIQWDRGTEAAPVSGTQWAELNANKVSALYQDIPTEPGLKVRWQVFHRGKKGIDTALVEFGAPGAPLVKQAEMSDGKEAWGLYTGEYTIPEGQTTTRFQFRSESAAGGNQDVGNLLDNIQFATQSLLQLNGTFSKDSTKIRQNVDYNLHITNTGGLPAANNTVTITVPEELTYTEGDLSSANTTVTNEKYDAATGKLTFEIATLKKDISADIKIPMTGAVITDVATPDTSITYNDENFDGDGYTAEAADDSVAVTSNEIPTIIGETDTTVQPNSEFDPMSTMKATDKEDGDITKDLVIKSNSVDTSKSGTYEVTYEVTDTDGNKTTFTRKVTVAEAPVITGDTQTRVNPNSTFDPMSTMKAMDKEDGDITKDLVVKSNSVDTSKAGTYEVTYEATDADGNKTTFTRTVIVTEVPIITGEDTIQIDRGTAFNPLDYVKASDKEDGDVTSKITVISNSVNSNQPGEYQVAYKVVDSDGNTATKSINVSVLTKGTITATAFTTGKDGYVQGAYTGDVARIAMIIDGQVFGKIPPAADGSYKYYAGSKITSTSNHVEMVAYDAKGKELDRTDVTIQAIPPTTGEITATDFTIGSSYITGAYTGDTTRIGVFINGKELTKIPASDNTYRYYVGSQVASLDDKVEVVAYDAKGKELDRTDVNIKQDTPTGTLTTDAYLIGGRDKYIRGTATGDINHVKLEVNGKVAASPALIQADKSFQYYTGNLVTSPDDKVVMVGYDAKGKEVSRTTVYLVATQGTVKVDTYQVAGTDKYIHGTTTGDVYRLKLLVNGEFLSSQTYVQPGNVFKYYVGANAISSADDEVVVVAYDDMGIELDRATVDLQ